MGANRDLRPTELPLDVEFNQFSSTELNRLELEPCAGQLNWAPLELGLVMGLNWALLERLNVAQGMHLILSMYLLQNI